MAFQVPKGEEKYDYVQSKFSEIAQKYDLFNDLITQGFHRYWKNQLVGAAGLQAGDQALDICCGTGDITERLEKAVGPSGRVWGLDFSIGMLQAGRSRDPLSNRRFVQGDAMNLPIRTGSMDAVTVGFGLRNLVRLEDGLDEVLRVLKPGGRFMCLDMGKVTLPIAKDIFRLYFFHVVPKVGRLLYPGQDMFDYFPASSLEYPAQEKLSGLLKDRGFTDVSFTNYHLGSTVIHKAYKPA